MDLPLYGATETMDEAFDLLESLCTDLRRYGREALANDLSAGFARGTGGIDAAYLRDILFNAITE